MSMSHCYGAVLVGRVRLGSEALSVFASGAVAFSSPVLLGLAMWAVQGPFRVCCLL